MRNPADHQDVVGQVQEATLAEVDQALAWASEAAAPWAATAPTERANALLRAADLLEAQKGLGRLAGVKVEYLGGYPGWKPDMSSKALAATKKVYTRLFGQEPGITAIHAGLECGLIGERVPGMDMVSFGPHLVGVHAPGERVSIPSTQKFWTLLGAVLDDLSA